jgi:hypothetical protein
MWENPNVFFQKAMLQATGDDSKESGGHNQEIGRADAVVESEFPNEKGGLH